MKFWLFGFSWKIRSDDPESAFPHGAGWCERVSIWLQSLPLKPRMRCTSIVVSLTV